MVQTLLLVLCCGCSQSQSRSVVCTILNVSSTILFVAAASAISTDGAAARTLRAVAAAAAGSCTHESVEVEAAAAGTTIESTVALDAAAAETLCPAQPSVLLRLRVAEQLSSML